MQCSAMKRKTSLSLLQELGMFDFDDEIFGRTWNWGLGRHLSGVSHVTYLFFHECNHKTLGLASVSTKKASCTSLVWL